MTSTLVNDHSHLIAVVILVARPIDKVSIPTYSLEIAGKTNPSNSAGIQGILVTMHLDHGPPTLSELLPKQTPLQR